MFPPIPLPETAEIFTGLALSTGFALRSLLPAWWRTTAVRRAFAATVLVGLFGFVLWGSAPLFGAWGLSSQGVGLAWLVVFVLASLAVTLPIAAVVRVGLVGIGRIVGARQSRATPAASLPPSRVSPVAPAVPVASPAPVAPPTSSPVLARRVLLEGTAAALPLFAVGQSLRGFVGADDAPKMPVVRMRFADLPRELEGLRILHLSDLHLGVSFHVDDLERLLERARAARPHLVLLTGDLADDPREIPPALRAIAELGAPLGAFASIGNHEYLHDIRRTRPLFDKSPVPLLLDEGTTLRVGNARLYLAGADDPVYLAGTEAFLTRSFDRAAKDAPTDAFRLLLSHRPEGFLPASARGFHLTLSGHTHGGQIGLAGKSVFERLERPAWLKYAWGSYARGPSRLYTTSGFGHWFPFRLACPTEVPLVVLERQ